MVGSNSFSDTLLGDWFVFLMEKSSSLDSFNFSQDSFFFGCFFWAFDLTSSFSSILAILILLFVGFTWIFDGESSDLSSTVISSLGSELLVVIIEDFTSIHDGELPLYSCLLVFSLLMLEVFGSSIGFTLIHDRESSLCFFLLN